MLNQTVLWNVCIQEKQNEGRRFPHVVCSCGSPLELQPGCQTRTGHQMWRFVVLSVFPENVSCSCLMFLSSSACRALVDEMDWAISQIDPKKMIQTGSFRINPDGSQSIREVRHQLYIHFTASGQNVFWILKSVFALMVFSFPLIFSGSRFLWLALRETSWSWWRACVRGCRTTGSARTFPQTGSPTSGSSLGAARPWTCLRPRWTPESHPVWSLQWVQLSDQDAKINVSIFSLKLLTGHDSLL